MDELEELIESWINGNRQYVLMEYVGMKPMERNDFIEYLKTMEDKELFGDIVSALLAYFIDK